MMMMVFTSYLQLRDRLSQVWLNKYTLALLLAMIKLIFFSQSIGNALGQSEGYILSHCGAIDSIYNEAEDNTPYYMAVMGNYLIREAMILSIKGTLETLVMIVHASEGLINFVIDIYLGTYACLLLSAVDGTVDIATNTTEKLLGAVNHTVSSVANEIDDGLDDMSKVINKVLSGARKVEDLFTGDNDDVSNNIHKVNLTIDSLRNLHIPSSINDKLEKLSNNTPNFAQAKNLSKKLIGVPFDEVIKDIRKVNATSLVGNSSVLYVPRKNNSNGSQNGICKVNEPDIKDFYNGLGHALTVTTVVCTIILILCALCATIPVAFSEFRIWDRLLRLQTRYIETEKEDLYAISDTDSNSNPFQTRERATPNAFIVSYQQCFHHWNARISNALVSLLDRIGPQGGDDGTRSLQKVKVRWVVAYITSERALCVLGIGILGLAVTVLQLILVAVLRNSLNNIGDLSKNFKDTNMVKTLENDMSRWTHSANLYINNTQNNINDQVFGWVDKTTVAVNHTVNEMINQIDDTLADAFNGTLFYKPMKTVVGCVIENKLYAVEKAMTWVHDKAHLDIPDINLSEIKAAIKKNDHGNPIALPKIKYEMHRAIELILNGFHQTAIYELAVALAILGIWLLQIPIALSIIFYRTTRISKY